MNRHSLVGSTVLVTGANGGIGTEFVLQALQRGAGKVYATARTPQTWEDERVIPLALDVLNPESVAAALAVSGDVTVVVNNAGIYPPGDSLLHGDQESARKIFDTNFFGPIEIVRAYAPSLAVNGGGAVINVHSAASWRAGNGAYSASKAALWSATNALRLELSAQGTHVLGLYMSWVETPMIQHEDRVKKKALPSMIVAATYDGLESGSYEVLADEDTRSIREKLSQPVEAMYSMLARDSTDLLNLPVHSCPCN